MTNDQISRTRLAVYLNDFMQSREFSEYILQRRLPSKKGPKSKLIHLAFNTSLIVSYSRPFTGNKNAAGRKEPSPLRNQVDELLNEGERKLHGKVFECRNSTYAHSDARMHLIPGSSYKSGSAWLMADPFYALLTESETATLKGMINKWTKYLRAERSKLRDRRGIHATLIAP